MTVSDLQRLYDYGYWANQRLLEAVSRLTPEQFTQPIAGSYESIRNTLVHMMSAEWGWCARCGGPPRGPALDPANFPTLESVTGTWRQVEAGVRAFLQPLTDADLDRIVVFQLPPLMPEPRAIPLGHLMQHAAVHAVHHRGQVALLLRMLGQAPGNFDVLFYDAARSAPVQPL
jgi:uncharacterized damage-inducible protein DinB